MSNASIHERRAAVLADGWASLHPIYVDRASNAEVWDVEGTRYIDFGAGIAVTNTGHAHPKVTQAVQEQVGRFSHTCFMINPYESIVELAEKLVARLPGPSPKKAMFVNSGAEAVENAVKIARYATGRRGVIAFKGGFHGRTMMTMALTGKVSPYKKGFGPLPGGVYHAPFPYQYRGITTDDALQGVRDILASDVGPDEVAAIIVEPVIGEGGFMPAPVEFLQGLRSICDEHGIVLIVDEVQTGVCRTGTFFAHEQAGIEADLVTMAKGLAGGYPLSAVLGKAEIMDSVHIGGVGGTYGGSPVGSAAALAVLEVVEEEDLVHRAEIIGKKVKDRLDHLSEEFDQIGEIRGPGAMVAVELVSDPDAKTPDPDLTKRIVAEARDRNLLILSCGVYGNVIRFLPALTIGEDTLDEGLDLFEQAFRAAVT